jgi:hypothetical protein
VQVDGRNRGYGGLLSRLRGRGLLPVAPGAGRGGERLGRVLGGSVRVHDRIYRAGQRPGRRSELEGKVAALRTKFRGRVVG